MKKDYYEIEKIYKQNIPILADYLNKKHAVNHSKRYWEIVVGPWFRRFLAVSYDRWEIITCCSRKNRNSLILLDGTNAQCNPSETTYEFVMQTVEDPWNDCFFGQISDFLKIPKKIINEKSQNYKKANKNFAKKFYGFCRNSLKAVKENLSTLFSYYDNYVLCDTYLPKSLEALVQLSLFQIPKKLTFKKEIIKKNNSLRKKEIIKLKGNKKRYLSFLSEVLWKYIPKCFIENYHIYIKNIKNSFYPKNPKAIFTSNSHYYNELFKMYAAEKVESGTRLIIGQHGGFYGVAAWGSEEAHEIQICDKYLSWGWKSKNKKVIPFGILYGRPHQFSLSNNERLLLIQNITFRYALCNASFPTCTDQWESYFNDQIKFVNKLSEKIISKTYIRLMPGFQPHDEALRWKEQIPKVKFDERKIGLINLLKKYRLAVVSYQGTPLNELLYYNFPVVAFWNPKHWEIRKSAKPIFELLENTKVLHKNPQSAAQFISKHWDNIDKWWNQKNVQTARLKFCKNYANYVEKPRKKLTYILKEAAN